MKGSLFQRGHISTEQPISEEKRGGNRTLIKRLSQFGADTSIHGCRFLSKGGGSRTRRCLWLVLILTCLGALTYQIVDRMLYYYSRPTTVNVKLNFNKTLKFPSVTICNQNAFKSSLTANQGRYRLIEEMYSPDDSFNSSSFQVFTENLTLDNLFLQTAHSRQDFIFECTWRDSKCSPDEFTTTLTDHGVCYTWHKREKENFVTSPGIESGLRLKVNIEQYEYMPGPHGAAGLKFLVHDEDELPMVHALGQAVSPGAHVFVGVRLTEINNLPEPYGNCSEKKLEYVTHYSQTSCKLNCLSKIADASCQCRHFYMPHQNGKPAVCTIAQYFTCLRDVIDRFPLIMDNKCDCPVPCKLYGFETDLSYGGISKYAIDKFITANVSKILSEKLMLAKEVSSKMDKAKLEDLHETAEIFEEELHHVKEMVLHDLHHAIHDTEEATSIEFQNLKWMCEIKSFLYDYQMYIVEKNFVRFRDALEERHGHVVALNYKEFISNIQEDIVYMNSLDNSESSLRKYIYSQVSNRLSNRQEIVKVTMVNYTQLINAYAEGEELFNYQYQNISRSLNSNVVPKKLLQDSMITNIDSLKDDVSLYLTYLNETGQILESLKQLVNELYSEIITFAEKELQTLVQTFIITIENWLSVRHSVYQSAIEYPLKVLEANKNELSQICFSFETQALSFEKRLEALDVKIETIDSTLFRPIDIIHDLIHDYLNEGVGLKYDIAKNFTSGNILLGKANLERFLYELLTDETSLKIALSEIKTLALDIQENVLCDQDAWAYYENAGYLQLLRNFSEVKDEILNNFTNYIDSIEYYKIVGEEGMKFAAAVDDIVEYFGFYLDSLKLNEKFIRENFAQIDVFYRQMNYEEITQQKAFDTFSLFCDIGGSMGLFLGASLLSICEIIDLVLNSIRVKNDTSKEKKENPKHTIFHVKPAVRHFSYSQ